MAERRLEGLQRVLDVYPLASSAYGNVGSSIYYALGLVASLALGLTPIVFMLSGAIFFLTASTYAEATAMYPEAGGSSSFARRAFNEFWSFFAAWGQMLNYMLTIATSAFFVPHYIGGLFWPALGHPPGDVLGGMLVILILALINIRGVKESIGVNLVLAVIDFCTQVLIVIVGLILVFSPTTLVNNVHLGVAPKWGDFLVAIPLCMLAYTGIETISNMSEEAKNPGRTVPSAINRVVIAVFTIYALLPAIALSALPVYQQPNGKYVTKLGIEQQHGGYAGDPVLGVVRALHLGPLQHAAEVYVGLLAATILFIATNAGILGVSRLTYSMGIHRQVPDRLRQLHPRYGTPWIGIVLFSSIAALTLIPGQATFLGNLYAFGAMLSFTIAHVSVTRLRVTKPDVARPYRPPGNLRVGGVDWPLFAIIGGACTFASLLVLAALHTPVAIAGIGWLTFGIFVYIAYRRRHGLDLTTTTQVAIPKPVVEHEAEYESVLVAFDAGNFDPNVLATAARMAARKRRGIHVLVTIPVPANSPIDASLPDQEAAAQSVVEEAKVQGGRRVSGHWDKVRAGQTGRRIVDEAREMRAEAIVMPMSRGGHFGRALETVLRERPCRVIIESTPERPRERRTPVAA